MYLRASAGLIWAIVSDSDATYTPGVSEKRGATSTFYHADIKNSVEQTSTSQSVVASRQYDAFGNEVSSQGPWQGPFQYGGAFGYHTDSDYGLKHLGARYYDSTTGRFLSRDPIKDGRNWYIYANNNPVTLADPTGELAWVVVAIAVVGAAGAIYFFKEAAEFIEDARRRKHRGVEDVEEKEREAGGLEYVPVAEIERAYRPDPSDIDRARDIIKNAYVDQYVYNPIAKVHWTLGAANAGRKVYGWIARSGSEQQSTNESGGQH